MSGIQQILMTSGGSYIFNYVISSNVLNFNLKSAAIAAGWNQISPLYATVTINTGVYVGSSATSTYSFDTGITFPAGTQLILINNGNILGCGGAGGHGGGATITAGGTGLQGGPALRAQYALSVTGPIGAIIGGGGGGGGGGGANSTVSGKVVTWYGGGGGGGGQGYSGGTGGVGTTSANFNGGTGGTGSTTSAGTAGPGGTDGVTSAGNGGVGGALGGPGAAGQTSAYAGGAAGAAGSAVVGNSNIVWSFSGSIYGALI